MKKQLNWLIAVTGVPAIFSLTTGLAQQPSQDLVKPWDRILSVRTVAFSPDGRLLAGGAGDAKQEGEVVIWDAKTLKVRLVHHVDIGVPSVAFSPDSKTLAIASHSEHCYLLDADTGKVKATLSGHGEAARCVAFAPDGNTLAIGSLDHDVHLWDWRAGKRVRTLKDHIDQVYLVAYSPDGKILVSCGTRR
jgi:tricorn protease-like protein